MPKRTTATLTAAEIDGLAVALVHFRGNLEGEEVDQRETRAYRAAQRAVRKFTVGRSGGSRTHIPEGAAP